MKGFTLPELLLSIAIIAILSGLSVPVYQSFQVKNDLDVAVNTTAQSLRRAQVLSQTVDGDISRGVNVGNSAITVFKGSSFASRDSNFDEVFDLPTTITPSGLQEIVFNKFSGLPQNSGTMTLSSTTNETKTLNLNGKGMVEY